MNNWIEIRTPAEARASDDFRESFSIMARDVSVREFAEFAVSTGYVTYFQQFDGPTWLDNDFLGERLLLDDVAARADLNEVSAMNLTAIDADAFCKWAGDYRIPTTNELGWFAEHIQLEKLPEAALAATYELVELGIVSELGYACLTPLLRSVDYLNRIQNQKRSYLDRMRETLIPITLDAPGAGFRMVKRRSEK